MLTNLKVLDIVNALKAIPSIVGLFPGGIKSGAPLDGSVFPWMYVTKFELYAKDDFTKVAHVEISIVGDHTMVTDEMEDMFIAIDNELLPDVDGCLPIAKFGDVDVTHIEGGNMTKSMYDEKENIIKRKTYNFTYIIQN